MPNPEDYLRGLDLEEADALLRWAPRLPLNLLQQVTPAELGNPDQDGVLEWFPRNHPVTGAKLSRQARRQWFVKALETKLSDQYDLSLSATKPGNDSPSSVNSKSRMLAILISLLSMKYALENGFLPIPESL